MESQLLQNYSETEKTAYLSAIASLATADRQASGAELEFLQALAQQAGLSGGATQRVLAAAQDSNKSMIDKPLDNLSLRTSRRVGFSLTFDHSTTSTQLHAIIADALKNMKAHALVTQDVQMKFSALTPTGKEVTVQYFVETSSYDEYLDVKEDLNYRLVEVVEHHGGVFSTTQVAVANSGKS